MKKIQQKGFSIAAMITIMLVITLIGIMGFLSWRIITGSDAEEPAINSQDNQESQEQKDRAEEIRQTVDQDKLKQNIIDATNKKTE